MTTLAPSPLATSAKEFGSSWWILLIVGIAWIVIGFVVLRFDNSTVNVISVVFGILVLLSAVNEIFRAAISVGGWRVWHVIFAALPVIGAAIAFINPGATFESLAIVVGIYFVVVRAPLRRMRLRHSRSSCSLKSRTTPTYRPNTCSR